MMTADLLVIVPSRGRPKNIERLLAAWQDTAATAALLVAVDDDDPTVEEYRRCVPWLEVGPSRRIGPILNDAAVRHAAGYRYLGFLGDDHCPRTHGWDNLCCEALDGLGGGVVYGNDLLQGPNLPTAVFLSSWIVSTLGYMCPPGLQHMFLDNAWKDWGEGIGRLRYLPDVTIEHLHPVARKADHDDIYASTGALMAADQAAYNAYRADGLQADLATLRERL